MRIYFFIAFLLFSASLQAQKFDSTYVFTILEGKKDTLSAVFNWVAENIQYDAANRFSPKSYSHPYSIELLNDVWQSKQGVCMHFAELLNAFYNKLDIESYTVVGYAINEGVEVENMGHSWNMVKWHGKWYGMDATWASGYMDANKDEFVHTYNPKWGKVSPDSLIYSHIPYDPLWQMKQFPLNRNEILAHQNSSKQDTFYVEKELKKYKQQDSLQQILASLERMKSRENDNKLQMKYIQKMKEIVTIYNKNAEIMKQRKEAFLYNQISNDLNLLVTDFNIYIAWYNSRFQRPKWTDEQVATNMEKMKTAIKTIDNQLQSFHPETSEMKNLLRDLTNNYQQLKGQVDKLQRFTEKYLATETTKRSSLSL